MDRPYIVCHMIMSLDGKINGSIMETGTFKTSGEEYERANESYQPQAWLCGRVTTEENFTLYKKPKLDDSTPTVPDGDYIAAKDADMYYISADSSGKVGWESNVLHFADRPVSHVVELLSEKASPAYRAFLRTQEISYIIAGKEYIDCALAATKLKSLLQVKTLMLSGGGFVNWSFLQAGVVDELSLVIAPVANGEESNTALFRKSDRLSKTIAADFTLKNVDTMDNDTVWLRYLPKKSS